MSRFTDWFFGADVRAALNRIERRLATLSSQEQQLDTDIQALAANLDSGLTDLNAAVQAILAKVGTTVDLTDEIAAVQAANARLSGITDAAKTLSDAAGGATTGGAGTGEATPDGFMK